MDKEKGITLIEVLAAITIFFIVIGVCYSVFSSVNLFVRTSEENYNRHTDQNFTIHMITKEMADPVELYYTQNRELRFKNFKGEIKAIRYEASTQKLSMVSSSSTTIESFSDRESLVLSENITNFLLTDQNGNPIPTDVLLDTAEMYRLSIAFQTSKPNQSGTKTSQIDEVTIHIKPFKQ